MTFYVLDAQLLEDNPEAELFYRKKAINNLKVPEGKTTSKYSFRYIDRAGTYHFYDVLFTKEERINRGLTLHSKLVNIYAI